MLTYQMKAGVTNASVVIRVVDSADGTPETAVEHNTAGIDLWYRREGEVSIDITEAALAALTTAHTDGGIEHINDGYYRLDLPDDAVDTDGGSLGVMVGGTVTGMVVIGCYIQLSASNIADVLSMLDDARAEPAQGTPPVNPDSMTKLDYLYKAWRNKSIQTATLLSLYADNGTTVDQKSIISDAAGVTTRGEMATGA